LCGLGLGLAGSGLGLGLGLGLVEHGLGLGLGLVGPDAVSPDHVSTSRPRSRSKKSAMITYSAGKPAL
jgi:hypothetical protein